MTQAPLANPSVAESRLASTEPVRVLLVDDNEAMLARAAAVLDQDYVVVGAVTDGLSGDPAARSRPHVIVLDMSMPGMSGLDAAILLRKADPDAAIVFLTVHHEEEFVCAARAAGGLGYVLKRRLVSDLAHAIREARRGHLRVAADRAQGRDVAVLTAYAKPSDLYFTPEARVRADHSLRFSAWQSTAGATVASLQPAVFDDRPAVDRPEQLLRALLLQMLYSVRSEHLLRLLVPQAVYFIDPTGLPPQAGFEPATLRLTAEFLYL